MVFLNITEIIGRVINVISTNFTGSIVGTIMLILIFLIVICVMFDIPLEFLSVIILPFCIVCASYYSYFMLPIVVICLYVSILIAKNFLFR